MKHSLVQAVLVSLALAAGASAFASQDEIDIDSHFRAKIAKEKVRLAAEERKAKEQGQDQGKTADNSQCGSQNIGNVNTGGRIGTTPREVFVFAPNAINLVNSNGCR